MSVWRDANLIAFQEHTGLKPARGRRRQVLERMQQAAFDLIKIFELEISGIREGDGYWAGSDVVHGMVDELRILERKLDETTNDMPVEKEFLDDDDLPF